MSIIYKWAIVAVVNRPYVLVKTHLYFGFRRYHAFFRGMTFGIFLAADEARKL